MTGASWISATFVTSFLGTVKFFSDSVWSLLGILLVSETPGGSTGKLSAGVSTGKYSSGALTGEYVSGASTGEYVSGASTGEYVSGASTGEYVSGASTGESSTGFACAVLPSTFVFLF